MGGKKRERNLKEGGKVSGTHLRGIRCKEPHRFPSSAPGIWENKRGKVSLKEKENQKREKPRFQSPPNSLEKGRLPPKSSTIALPEK